MQCYNIPHSGARNRGTSLRQPVEGRDKEAETHPDDTTEDQWTTERPARIPRGRRHRGGGGPDAPERSPSSEQRPPSARRSIRCRSGALARIPVGNRGNYRPMTAAISIRNVTLGYNRHPAVHHVDTEVEAGSLTALVGPNGSGKSTLLKGIAGSLAPLEGNIMLRADSRREGRLPPAAIRDRSGVPPFRSKTWSPWASGGKTGPLAEPPGRSTDAYDPRSTRSASQASSDGQSERYPAVRCQRTLFARLLLQDADVVLLDEPFTAIDATTSADLLRVIRQWHSEGRTVITVLHDIENGTCLVSGLDASGSRPWSRTEARESCSRPRIWLVPGG